MATEEQKKTAEAHETVAEQTPEEATKKMIEKDEAKDDTEAAEEKKEKVEATEDKARSKDMKKGRRKFGPTKEEILAAWVPKTKLGKDVKDGKVKNIDDILDADKKILEESIVDSLVNIESDLILIGQSKGKFGGGKRRAWRQTQRITREGGVMTFSAMAVVGDKNGHIGIGIGKAGETLPARDKATRQAKINIMKITRACAAFDCDCSDKHSVPFEVTGKQGSVIVTLIPAPQGTGLVCANELKKVLKLAGIKDVYSKTFGKQRTTYNLIKACINALKETNRSNIQ